MREEYSKPTIRLFTRLLPETIRLKFAERGRGAAKEGRSGRLNSFAEDHLTCK